MNQTLHIPRASVAKLFFLSAACAQICTQPATAREKLDPFSISDLSVKGRIEGENITFLLKFQIEVRKKDLEVDLVSGDMVLDQLLKPGKGAQARYTPSSRTYSLRFSKAGTYEVEASWAARPATVEGGPWLESTFTLPSSKVRELEVTCDRKDLEVLFPGALRLEREASDGKLTIRAILGPGQPFAVRWKPQIQELDARLVFTNEANHIVSVGNGVLREDSLFSFQIAQGKLEDVSFDVPEGLNVTQVRGDHIRDWRIIEEAGGRSLGVHLNTTQSRQYRLQVLSEIVLPAFPAERELKVVESRGGIRSSGHLALGTDHAVRVVVAGASGLTQMDEAEFPRIALGKEFSRPLPKNHVFFYSFSAGQFQLNLSLDDILPSFDAMHRLVVELSEENLTIQAGVELDIRDAPIRQVTLEMAKAFVVSGVAGQEVEDYSVQDAAAANGLQQVEVRFRRPVLGRTMIEMRLEKGRGGLEEWQKVSGWSVPGAKSERGYLVVAASQGIEIDTPRLDGLREVHPGSLPLKVSAAKLAYRFREKGWSLELLARRKSPGIRAEAFHLAALGDRVLYGHVIVQYFISGAPVDEFHFRIPQTCQNVEFISREVRRWTHEGDEWTVKLQSKVVGDFTLGISYHERYEDGGSIGIGEIECLKLERETGFLLVSSHLDLKLRPPEQPAESVLEIDRDEAPANYRLLVNAPVLKSYKYVNTPHRVSLAVSAYGRQELITAAIEIMDLTTEVSPTEKGDAESVTRVRYKLKNAGSQFLSLRMPAGAEVWATRLIGRGPAGSETAEKVAASQERGKGVLLIPLKRLRNPNEPITVELVYGQAHRGIGWAGHLDLAAPQSFAPATFARWEVRAPKEWSALSDPGGNMSPEERTQRRGDLGRLLESAGQCWAWAWMRLAAPPRVLWVAGAVIAGWILIFCFRRQALRIAMTATALAGALVLGIAAARAPEFRELFLEADDLRSLSFAQPMNLQKEVQTRVELRVIPSWRQHATLGGAVVVPALAGLCLLLAALVKRARRLFFSLAAGGLLYAAALFPAAAAVLGHFFTWGIPVILVLAYAGPRLRSRMPALEPSAAATAVLLAAVWMAACPASAVAEDSPKPNEVFFEKIECRIQVEKDSVEVNQRFRIQSPGPGSLTLIARSVILLSAEKISEHLRLSQQDGRLFLQMGKKGVYEGEVQFVTALERPGADSSRSFRLPLPLAVTNSVEFIIPETGLKVEVPGAARWNAEEAEKETRVKALFAPGEDAFFRWRPRARETRLEATVYFCESASVARLDAGVIAVTNRVRLQVAQGELKEIRVRIPEGTTVTAVEGEELGAWRFDLAARELDARLNRPVAGGYEFRVLTQMALGALPATVTLKSLEIVGAERQRWALGLAASPDVHLSVLEHPQAMNVEDFKLETGCATWNAGESSEGREIRHAYRMNQAEEGVRVEVSEVRPEIRTQEKASFTIADDRLVYNGELAIAITKAGRFSVTLSIPAGYDIDSLDAAEVSHWDEEKAEGSSMVQVHFRKKLLGTAVLRLALSQAVGEFPTEIQAPRIEVDGSLKHTGILLVSSDPGVRLSLDQREGVIELNPLELGIRAGTGVLAFKTLKPDWQVSLHTEVIEPRITADFLHVARISDGLVAHTHWFRFRPHNAGVKVFEVSLPKNAFGVLLTGPEIVQKKEMPAGSGRWRLELAKKWFQKPYPLTIQYEKPYDRVEGKLEIEGVTSPGSDLQNGHVVIVSPAQVEVQPSALSPSLQPAEVRGIPALFGAGDLSHAAFCYRGSSSDYQISLRATRHEPLALLEAEVTEARILSVVNERAESITQIGLKLNVGSRQHLAIRLPRTSSIWSVFVNGKATSPSKKNSSGEMEEVLIPLAHAARSQGLVHLECVYVASHREGGTLEGPNAFAGPQFDLPLRNLEWRLYLPPRFKYGTFDSTLTMDENQWRRGQIQAYDLQAYEAEVLRLNREDQSRALELQGLSRQLADRGFQQEAKQALESAYHYSLSDPALNEDTRVQLHRLIQQQAVMGLVCRRDWLRPAAGGAEVAGATGLHEAGDRFLLADAERVRNSLTKSDSENLELITQRMIETQEAAAGPQVQLRFGPPTHGRVLELRRPLQVQPNTPMRLSFEAKRDWPSMAWGGVAWAGGLFLALWMAWNAVAVSRARGLS